MGSLAPLSWLPVKHEAASSQQKQVKIANLKQSEEGKKKNCLVITFKDVLMFKYSC